MTGISEGPDLFYRGRSIRGDHTNKENRVAVRFHPDPVNFVIAAFESLYPGHDVSIFLSDQVLPDGGGAGRLEPDSSRIFLSPYLSYANFVETLIHELAHVACDSCSHGPEFEAERDAIEKAYLYLLEINLGDDQTVYEVDLEKVFLPFTEIEEDD